MATLHSYILRELLKSFGLSVLALTALFTMGGGLYNVLKFEGVTTADIFTVLPMLLPIVVTLTMPVAALFSATITYGRFAADNEFVAARAAGINIHRLFLSSILLAVFVTLFTLLSVNLVIPRFMKGIEYFARTNMRDFAYNRLMQRGYIHYAEPGKERVTLTAQRVLNVAEDQLIARGFEPPGDGMDYFWVEQPTFLMAGKDRQLRQFTVAEGGLVQFDTRNAGIKLTLHVKGVRIYDGKRVIEMEFQKIGPYSRAIPFTPKPSMMDLATLRRWDAAPWESPKYASRIRAFIGELRAQVFREIVAERLADGGRLTLTDRDGLQHEIEAAGATLGTDKVILDDVRVTRRSPAGDGDSTLSLRYEAPRGRIKTSSDGDDTRLTLDLEESDDRRALEIAERADGFNTSREKSVIRLDDLSAPPTAAEMLQACTPAGVLDPSASLPSTPDLDKKRKILWKQALELKRKIKGVIHFRMSFALSALVTIIMGAALGVIFRGSRALAAFGLACIPFAVVAILISMGKQMIESDSSQAVGPFLIWGGLAAVGLTDMLIMRFGIRR